MLKKVLVQSICTEMSDRSHDLCTDCYIVAKRSKHAMHAQRKFTIQSLLFVSLYQTKLLQYESFSCFSAEIKVYFPYRTKKAIPPTLNVDTVSQTSWGARTVSQYDKHANSIHNDPPTTVIRNVTTLFIKSTLHKQMQT